MQKIYRVETMVLLSYIQTQKYIKNRLFLFFFLHNPSAVTHWNRSSFKGYIQVNFVILLNSIFSRKKTTGSCDKMSHFVERERERLPALSFITWNVSACACLNIINKCYILMYKYYICIYMIH